MFDINSEVNKMYDLQDKIQALENQIEETRIHIEEESTKLNTHENLYKTNERQAIQNFEDSILEKRKAPLVAELSELQKQKNDLESKYNEQLKAINDYVVDNSHVIKDVDDISEKMLAIAENFYGISRDVLLASREKDNDNISFSISQFNTASEKYENSKLLLALETCLQKMDSMIEKMNSYLAIVAIVFIVIIFFLPGFLMSSFLVLLLLSYLYSNNLITYIDAISTLKNNADETVKELDKENFEFLESKRDQLNNQYNEKLDDLNNLINDKQISIQNLRLDDSEQFDIEEFKMQFNAESEHIKEVINNLKNDLEVFNKDKLQLNDDLAASKLKLDAVVQEYKNSCMSENSGSNIEYSINFLFDIDDKNYSFNGINNSKESLLFLYDNEISASNLITLMIYEIRSQILPRLLNFVINDIVLLGSYLQKFQTSDETLNYTFLVNTTVEDSKNVYKDLIQKLIDNIQVIQAEFPDITQYNKNMDSIGATMMPYNIIFEFGINDNDNNLSKIIKNGSKFGYIVYKFVSYENFFKGKESSADILNEFSKVYILQDDSIKSRAKSFIQRQLIAK